MILCCLFQYKNKALKSDKELSVHWANLSAGGPHSAGVDGNVMTLRDPSESDAEAFPLGHLGLCQRILFPGQFFYIL